MQTLEHNSQTLLTGPWGTRTAEQSVAHQPLRSEASEKHLPQKRSSLRRDFRIRQNNVNMTHTRDQKKKSTVPPHSLNLKTNLESLLLSLNNRRDRKKDKQKAQFCSVLLSDLGFVFLWGFCPFFPFFFFFFLQIQIKHEKLYLKII